MSPSDVAGDAFAAAAAPRVLRDRLEGRTVAVLALPGVDDGVVDALDGRVEDAGGRVVGRYAVTPTLLEPGEKQLVDSLGEQVIAEYAKQKDGLDRAAPPYERLGRLVALVAASTDRGGQKVTSRDDSVLASLVGAGVLTVEGEPGRKAPLLLVVLGDEPADVVLPPEERAAGALSEEGDVEADVEAAETATDAVLSGLLVGLGDGASGVLLAGSAASGADGALARLREDGRLGGVSTLDGVDTEVGQVSAPLALRRLLDGSAGSYGASGADGAVPVP